MNRIWESKNSLPGVMVLAALAVARPPMAFAAVQPSLQIVPQPREVRAAGAGFEPAMARFICVSAGAADRFTARLLQEALRETHGVDGNVVLLPPHDRVKSEIGLELPLFPWRPLVQSTAEKAEGGTGGRS